MLQTTSLNLGGDITRVSNSLFSINPGAYAIELFVQPASSTNCYLQMSILNVPVYPDIKLDGPFTNFKYFINALSVLPIEFKVTSGSATFADATPRYIDLSVSFIKLR